MESEIKMRRGEDADKMLLEKQVLHQNVDPGVSPTCFAIAKHSQALPSPNVLSERTMNSWPPP